MKARTLTLGFTIIEISIVITILIVLSTLVLVNLSGFQTRSETDLFLLQLNSDIKQQQLKAMNGVKENSPNPTSFGIYFDVNEYTLFEGTSYSESDPTNFVLSNPTGIQFSTVEFTNSSIVFEKGSGEITGYVDGNDSITILHSGSGNTTQLSMNKLGVFTSVE